MLLQNRLSLIHDQINVYLDEIAALQAKVTCLQTHAQEVQGAEQAAESALNQIDIAIAMLEAICPEEIGVFKSAIDAKFRGVLPQLATVDAIDTEVGPDVPPAPSEPEAIEDLAVVATVVKEPETQQPPQPTDELNAEETVTPAPLEPTIDSDGLHNGNGHHPLTYDQLRMVDRPTLIKLANSHNLANYKSKKRDELATMLDGIITPEELARAQNGRG